MFLFACCWKFQEPETTIKQIKFQFFMLLVPSSMVTDAAAWWLPMLNLYIYIYINMLCNILVEISPLAHQEEDL